jgi:hypothetical protein
MDIILIINSRPETRDEAARDRGVGLENWRLSILERLVILRTEHCSADTGWLRRCRAISCLAHEWRQKTRTDSGQAVCISAVMITWPGMRSVYAIPVRERDRLASWMIRDIAFLRNLARPTRGREATKTDGVEPTPRIWREFCVNTLLPRRFCDTSIDEVGRLKAIKSRSQAASI